MANPCAAASGLRTPSLVFYRISLTVNFFFFFLFTYVKLFFFNSPRSHLFLLEMPKSRVLVRARRKSSAQLEGNVSSDFAEMTSMDSDSIDPFSIYVSNTDNPTESKIRL